MKIYTVLALLVTLSACKTIDDEPLSEAEPLNLTSALGAGEVRAGVVVDEAALFGGVAGAGNVGDLKIYNQHVRFIIQSVRDGDYTVRQGGCVIDADLAWGEGQPGRDMVDDWVVMAGAGRIPDATSVEVVDDGAASGRAVIRVEGPESPVEYITGAVESEGIVPDMGLWFTTDYILEADSHLLEVVTTVSAVNTGVTMPLGDIILTSKEVGTPWYPGAGMGSDPPSRVAFSGFMAKWNHGALTILPDDPEGWGPMAALASVSSYLSLVSGFGSSVEIPLGESATYRRWYGVGPDLATLTDEWLSITGQETETVSGEVLAPDGPVRGARVNIMVDDAPFTLAITGDDGSYRAEVPVGSTTSVVVDGRGPALHADLPPGWASYTPYTGLTAQSLALDSLRGGATEVPLAEGRGFVEGSGTVELGEPGFVSLTAADGLPFEARLSCLSGCESADGSLVQGRPSGYGALAWSRDGHVSFPIEPATYSLLAHRGVRWELFQADIEVLAGEVVDVTVELGEAWSSPGWLVADPHSHAAPSPDGGITMEERVVVSAAVGIQVYFGTDHDHVVDYSPLLAPLGLDGVMRTVASTEISPVIRGHLNAYPLQEDPDAPNGGGWPWYWTENRVSTTEEQFSILREHFPGAILQVNHPMSGLAWVAGWSEGRISKPDLWSDDFDAVEVMNSGRHGEEVDFYLDLLNRGVVVAPMGVSDSHGHISGGPGLNVTYMHFGVDDPAMVTDAQIVEAVSERRTIASTGPFLEMSIPPGSVVVGEAVLDVEVRAPSWMEVETLSLLRDGQVVETVEGTEATFTLAPEVDASYVVEASSGRSMSPLTSKTPWALSSAILVDVDGDGWTPPLPPFNLGMAPPDSGGGDAGAAAPRYHHHHHHHDH